LVVKVTKVGMFGSNPGGWQHGMAEPLNDSGTISDI
jgi:hypothetical protein